MAEEFWQDSTNPFISLAQSNVSAANPFINSMSRPTPSTNPFIEYTGPNNFSNNPSVEFNRAINKDSYSETVRRDINAAEAFIDEAYQEYCSPKQSKLPGKGSGVPPPIPPRVRPSHSTAFHDTRITDISPITPAKLRTPEIVSPSARTKTPGLQTIHANANTEDGSKQLLKGLVDQFTTAVRESRDATSLTSKVKLRPPRFDGHGDVHLFIKQFREVAELCEWDDRVALVQLRSCLERKARDCARGDSLREVFGRLLAMFGLTPSQAREELHNLVRESNESYRSFGDRVDRLSQLAYGGLGHVLEKTLALEHFDRAVSDPTLRQHLLVVKPERLEDAIRAAEEYARVGASPPGKLGRHRIAPIVEDQDEIIQRCGRPSGLEEVLGRLSLQVDSISRRLETLETGFATRRQQKTSKNCFHCKEPGHFKRNCPLLKQCTAEVRKADEVATALKPQGN